MYYIVYSLLWLFSLLPLRVLYFFGDCIYAIVFYIIKYRKDIVINNIQHAFPICNISDTAKQKPTHQQRHQQRFGNILKQGIIENTA